MGQQQLLLVILVTIVIGIATVVSFYVISDRAETANRDAVRQDLSAAGSYVQSIWQRPQMLGGASGKFLELDEARILHYLNVPATNYQVGDTEATNENGTYSVRIDSDTQLTIIGVPKTGPPNIELTVNRNDETGQWEFEFRNVD